MPDEASRPSALGVALLLAWAAVVYGAYVLAYTAP